MSGSMRSKRLLLVTPPYHCGVVEAAGTWPPLTFAYLGGAARRAGFEVRVYDAMSLKVGQREIGEEVRAFAPDFVGVTAITATTPDALETARTVKRVAPETKTVLGGVHPTFMDEEVLRTGDGAVDFVLRGEGEESLPALLRALAGEGDPFAVPGVSALEGGDLRRGPAPCRPQDLDRLEAAHDLLDWRLYKLFVLPGSRLGAVSTSRGCDQACTFCSQQKFTERTWRARDPEACAREIARLEADQGVSVVLITDELPTRDRARWERFLEAKLRLAPDVYLLMETRISDVLRDADILPLYRKAGIIHVYVGAEATEQETLDRIQKEIRVEDTPRALALLKEHGMITETSYVLGLPEETPETVRETLRLAREHNADFAHFLAIAPWPYADLWAEVEPYVAVRDYRRYNLVSPVVKPVAMTLEEVDRAILDCYREYYMGKITEMATMRDSFRRDYMLRSMKHIMTSSFITSRLGVLGKLPAAVEKALRILGVGS